MTRPLRKERVRDAVDLLFDGGIAVDPDADRYRYVNLDADRYRYTNLDADRYRYIAPVLDLDTDRYRYADAERYLSPDGRYRTVGGRFIVYDVPSPTPPQSTDRLLWLEACLYDDCFDGYESELWLKGDGPDFSEAVASRLANGWYGDDDDADLTAVVVDKEEETFQPCTFYDLMEFELPFTEALDIREMLGKHPDLVAGELSHDDRYAIKRWAGLPVVPSVEQVEAAIRADPTAGLGGASLDFAAWLKSEFFGEAGIRLSECLSQLCNEYYVRILPVENFLLYTHSLRRDTVTRVEGGETIYPLSGEYAVSRVDYHSDLDGKVFAGWRSCWLEPYYRSTPFENQDKEK